MRRLLAVAPLALMACGNYTDPGSGSGTLRVIADARYVVGSGNETELTVRVTTPAGDDVDNALVSARDGKNDETFNVPFQANGRYRVTLAGYRRRLELKAEIGSDFVTAKLEGPGAHTITNPKAGAFSRTEFGGNLKVEWSTKDGIRTDEIRIDVAHSLLSTSTRTSSDDTGSYKLPMSLLPNPGDYDLALTRSNHIDLQGGSPGSVFTSSYVVATTFTLTN
jgi:hypothetical protein